MTRRGRNFPKSRYRSFITRLFATGITSCFILILALSVVNAHQTPPFLTIPFDRSAADPNQAQPCFASGCHADGAGGPFNNNSGDLQLNNFPDTFVPGETLGLGLQISGGQVYGVMIAALFEDGGQAGQLISQTNNVVTDTYEQQGVTVLVHSQPLQAGMVNFQWQSPENPSGPVTFRIASNSANGNGNNTGDLINFKTHTISPQQVTSEAPAFIFPQYVEGVFQGIPNRSRIILRNNSGTAAAVEMRFRGSDGSPNSVPVGGQMTDVVSRTIPAWGTLDIETDGTAGDLQVGPVEVIVNSGDPAAISAAEVFDLLGTFVSVPGSVVGSSQQVYVSFNADENTGVAVYNPDAASAATVEFILLDNRGEEITRKNLVFEPRRQRAVFVNEAELFSSFFSGATDFKGTLNLNVTAGPDIAVLGLIQKSSGALLAVPTSATAFGAASQLESAQLAGPATFIFPQYVDGLFNGTPNRSRIILRNNSGTRISGVIVFYDQEGNLKSLPVGGQTTDTVPFDLQPWGTLDIETAGTSEPLQVGPVEVLVESGDAAALSGTEIFDLLGAFVSVTGSVVSSRQQVYVSVNAGENTGVAVYNPDAATAASVEFVLLDDQGEERARKTLEFQPGQQRAVFVNEADLFQDFFSGIPDFQGTLNLNVTAGPHIAVLGLIQKATGPLLAVPTSEKAYVGGDPPPSEPPPPPPPDDDPY